eukprot:754452-Hanusia_phi.AAC.2
MQTWRTSEDGSVVPGERMSAFPTVTGCSVLLWTEKNETFKEQGRKQEQSEGGRTARERGGNIAGSEGPDQSSTCKLECSNCDHDEMVGAVANMRRGHSKSPLLPLLQDLAGLMFEAQQLGYKQGLPKPRSTSAGQILKQGSPADS